MNFAFLFDMDGTLVDTFDLIYDSFNKALAVNSKKTFTKQEFKETLFGKPVDRETYHMLDITDEKEVQKIMKDFQGFWFENLPKVKIFKDVRLTLEELKERGSNLGVVSTSPRDVIKKTLQHAGVYNLFDVFVGEEDVRNKKPHREPVCTALDALNLSPEQTFFVGDTVYDLMAGQTAGCRTVLLLNGYNEEVMDIMKPDYMVQNIRELLELS
jgi:pyrophosphatase PpaX